MSAAPYLAQGIMGGFNIHRHELVFTILGREREVHGRGLTVLPSRSHYVPFVPTILSLSPPLYLYLNSIFLMSAAAWTEFSAPPHSTQ